MEPVIKQSGKVMGIEVLCFPDAEIRKMKGGSTSFAASGPLSVLYFKDYHRFMLHLNDWRYPLMRRLPVTPSGKEEMGSRSYTFPALNGYSYELRINHAGNNNAMTNFETILSHNCNFASAKEEHRKLEASPDDKLVRHIKKDTTTMDVISETTKHVAEKAKIKTETLKHGTKYLTSTKKRMHLKDIKNKNFKKTARSTFKKDFFEAGEKMSQEFMRMRRENPNMSGTMDIDSLRKTSESKAPVVYLWKEEVEEAILNNKDLVSQGNFGQSNVGQGMVEEKKGFIQSIRQGLTSIKDSIASRIESRTSHAPEMKPQEATVEHYQG